ncbi:MAG: nitroreductase family protein [Acidimicrobiia bacterium]
MSVTYEFLLKLRAIRQYKPDPLRTADLEAILEAGRWTGSSKNTQDWSFVSITDPKRLQELADHGIFTDPIRNSVATIVLVKESGGGMFDIGRAAQNMMLAAKAVGVASCPVTLQDEEAARVFLGAPEGSVARYAISLGYPADDAQPARVGGRKRASTVIKHDHY